MLRRAIELLGRTPLAMPCLVALASALALPVEASDSRPNVLWIITDDHSDDAGYLGTPALSTPRLDGLAAEGVTYRNAYTTSPSCSPSRTAMMTGVYEAHREA